MKNTVYALNITISKKIQGIRSNILISRWEAESLSFSSNVKSELSHHFGEGRHCDIAEIAAIVNMCGYISQNEDNFCIKLLI